MNQRPDYQSMSDRALSERTAQRLDDLIEMKCIPAQEQRTDLFKRVGLVERTLSTWAGKVVGISLTVSGLVVVISVVLQISCGG